MFPMWVQYICILHFLVAVQAVPVRRNELYSSTIARRKPTTEDPYSVQFSSEESRENNQQQLPLQNARIFPTSVYNFQTGEVELPKWDLSESSSNQHSQETQNSDETSKPVEARPRRYSSKYAQGEESNIDENYEILKNPKPEGEQQQEEPEHEVKNTQPEESEQLKVYDQTENPVTLDNVKAESGHHKAPVSTKHQKGSGEEHHEGHHNKKKTKGLKDYKGEHHYHKGEKGHHDKENHKGQYSDKKGSTHAHKEGGGHYQSAVHGEKGQKEAKHSDKEEYKRATVQEEFRHTVHKKDEYEKKHEFYDEHHEGGDSEKHGEYFEEHEAKKGGHKKGGHKSGEAAGEHKAKKGHFEKGKKYHELIGHKKTGGHEKKHGHDEKYGKKEGHSNFKKYGYDSGGKGGDSGGAHSNNDHLHLALPPIPPSIAEATVAATATASVDPTQITVHKILKPQPELHTYKEVVRHPPPEILKKVETVETIKVVDPPSVQESRQVFSETVPVPSSELNPPMPKEQPKVTITRFKFPPAENNPAKE